MSIDAQRLITALEAIAAIPDPPSGDRGPIRQARHIAKCALTEAGMYSDKLVVNPKVHVS